MTAPSTTPLKVGVIGVGGIASTHFPGWDASPHAQVYALADTSAAALERVATAQNVTTTYSDPLELIRDPNVDIVDICTPNRYHAPLVVAALEAGKHVICEKPLAPTPEEVQRIIAAQAGSSGRLVMTAQHFRYTANARALHSELERGALGQVYHARAWMLRRSGAPTNPGHVMREHSGGGPGIDIGVHILDLALWMMGHPRPISVSGVTHTRLAKQAEAFSTWGGAIPESFDVEEFAGALVRFKNGASLALEVSWLLHHQTDSEDMQLWLYGDAGGAHWPSNRILSSDNSAQQLLSRDLPPPPELMEPHALECLEFAEAIASGNPSPVPPEQSLDMIRILDGLYRSAATGLEVRLDA